MLEPAPTTPIDPELARGTLESVIEATALQPAHVVLTFPNTNYRLYLLPNPASALEPLRARVGKRAIGTIRCEAKRVDRTTTGGRYVEPVYGRPRRVQGTIVAVNPQANTITVHAGMPVVAKVTAPGQKASDFEVGEFVGFAAAPGATFSPQAVGAGSGGSAAKNATQQEPAGTPGA